MTDRDDTPKVVFQCPLFSIFESNIQITVDIGETLNKKIWYLEKAPWVRVVPFDDSGNILLIKELQLSTGEMVWRIPGGGINNGEEPMKAAVRELIEEISFFPTIIEPLFVETPSVSWYRQKGYVFGARNLISRSSDHIDIGETIDIFPTKIDNSIQMADNGLFDAWTEKSIGHAINWYKKTL